MTRKRINWRPCKRPRNCYFMQRQRNWRVLLPSRPRRYPHNGMWVMTHPLCTRVPCPRCKAELFEPCINHASTVRLLPRPTVHDERYDLYQALLKKGEVEPWQNQLPKPKPDGRKTRYQKPTPEDLPSRDDATP